MLTATPSQPEVFNAWVGLYFNSFTPKLDDQKTNAFKLKSRLLKGVRRKHSVCCMLMAMVFAIASPVANADSVISTEQVEILEAGVFDDPTKWDFSSNRGFSFDQADYTMGMVADGEMSFTHTRPDNFQDYTAWASTGCSACNATFGESDGIYSWSRGPDITMDGYAYPGLISNEIETVSLVLHFSIPETLNDDEVNILLQNHGSDILVSSFARTLSPINRMTNPLVVPLDDYVDWDWSKLEDTQFTVDYVSDNEGLDDSEVRVDAVGLRVKYHQAWYSFENSKAEHELVVDNLPVIDLNIYEGEISGLQRTDCGLSPSGNESGEWIFTAEAPPSQQFGRIHTFGFGNHTIWSSATGAEGDYVQFESGAIMGSPESSRHIRIEIEDGCISGARIDVNDPRLVVSGRVTGGTEGLSLPSSNILFAIGENLVHTEPINGGQFSISVPVGYALPRSGELLEVGVATRFQWSSNGTAETTVVHISSISISGGYSIEWDRDPVCNQIGKVDLVEDEGGQIISFSSLCYDDTTASENLIVSAQSSNESLLSVEENGALLSIEPVSDANGEGLVSVRVIDEAGNKWEGSIIVEIQAVPDSPEIKFLPSILYIELGEEYAINPVIYDPDSDSLVITTSRSWAVVKQDGTIIFNPVEPGNHLVTISVNDGTSGISRDVEIVVTAKPDLLVEDIEVRVGGIDGEDLYVGEVVELIGFIRNQGRGGAENITFHCMVNDVLVGTGTIAKLSPGDLKMSICDVQLVEWGAGVTFSIRIDGTDEIEETQEGNNFLTMISGVDRVEIDDGSNDTLSVMIVVSILAILGLITAFQLGPRPIKREFERRK